MNVKKTYDNNNKKCEGNMKIKYCEVCTLYIKWFNII